MALKRTLLLMTTLILLTTSIALLGCGGTNGGGTTEGGTTGGGTATGNAPTYDLNEPVSFGGATFTFTGVEELNSIPVAFEDGEVYEPDNGSYLVVYFDFQGKAGNEVMGVDSAIFRLKDGQGSEYAMDTDLANYEMSALALDKDLANSSMLMWSNAELKHTLLVFDVDSGSSGYTLNLIESTPQGIETAATVDLGV